MDADDTATFGAAVRAADADALVDLGCRLSDDGDHLDAARCFRAAIDLGEEWASFDLGNELRALGRPDQAVEAYERALAVGETDAWLNLGHTLDDLGDLAGALRAYRAGRAAGDAHAGLSEAFLLRAVDDRDAAELVVGELAREGHPTARAVHAVWQYDHTHDPCWEDELRAGADRYDSARASLADLLARTDRSDEALEVLREGVARGERVAFLPLGNLYADHYGDVDAARAAYLAGIDAGDTHCHHNLAHLLAEQGDLDGAREHWLLGAAHGDGLAAAALARLDEDGDQDGDQDGDEDGSD